MKLHPISHSPSKNRYCGPAVISFLTGISTGDAARLLRRATGRSQIISTKASELSRVLREAGIGLASRHVVGRPTVAGWLSSTKHERTDGRVFLVLAARHWFLITEDNYACGRVEAIVTVNHEKVQRRARVHSVYEVTARPEYERTYVEFVQNVADDNTYLKEKATTLAKMRRDTKNLAKKNGFDIEIDTLGGGSKIFYLLPPDDVEQAHMDGDLDFTGTAYDWEDAAETLKYAIEAIKDWRTANGT